MANTLTNFLIGIGFDTKNFDKGTRQIDSGMGLIKSRVLLTSAALATGFAVASRAAINAGDRIDRIALSAAKYNTSAKFVNNYGNALKLLGGQAEESLQAVGAAEDALMQFRLKGSFSAFEDPTLAGIDTSALTQAASGEEFLRLLSEMIPGLNKDQQRLIQQNFGFSDATMASLRRGSQYFSEIVNRAEELAPGFDNATEAARKFNEQVVTTQLRFEGIGNTLADKLLPALGGVLEKINWFIDTNQGRIEAVANVAAKSPVGSSIATTGAGAVVAGQAAKMLGMRAIGTGVSRLGAVGAVVGGGMVAASLDEKDIESLTGVKLPPWLFRPTGELYDEWKAGKNPFSSSGGSSMLAPTPTAAAGRNQAKIQNNIALTVELDGNALDAKITDVQTRRDIDTMEDITSTTSR